MSARAAGSRTRRGRVPLVVVALTLAACQRETKVVSSNPFLGRLPGAQTQQPIRDLGTSTQSTGVTNFGASGGQPGDQAATPTDDLPKDKDGRRIVHCRNGRQLLSSILILVREDDADAFARQVLCDATLQEYAQRGLDPRDAFQTVKAREKDVIALARAMPLGEQTPGVILRKVAPGTLRVELSGPITRELSWRGFDMALEGANYRLRWFIGD